MKEDSGKGASLSAGALLGEHGGGASLLGIRKDMWRRIQGIGITLRGDSAGEPGRGLVNRGLVKALETCISLHRGPAGEPRRGLIYQGL